MFQYLAHPPFTFCLFISHPRSPYCFLCWLSTRPFILLVPLPLSFYLIRICIPHRYTPPTTTTTTTKEAPWT
jgi:hypothetical protein